MRLLDAEGLDGVTTRKLAARLGVQSPTLYWHLPNKAALVTAIAAHGHRHALMLPSPEKLAGMVHSLAKPGDYVICLGAGSITQWAYALPGDLAALDKA